MNMCIKEKREGIQRGWRPKVILNSTKMNLFFQKSPFSQERDLSDKPPMPKRPTDAKKKKIQTYLTAATILY